MRANTITAAVATAAIVLAGAFIVHRLRGTPEAKGFEFLRYVGERLAEETAELVKDGDAVLVIEPPDLNATPDQVTDVQTAGFLQHLSRLRPRSVVNVAEAEADFMAMQAGGPTFSAAEFRRLLAAYPDCRCVVSLAGAFGTDAALAREWGPDRPKVVVLAYTLAQVSHLMRAGIVQKAVVSREEAHTANPDAADLQRARFDREFRVLTTATSD